MSETTVAERLWHIIGGVVVAALVSGGGWVVSIARKLNGMRRDIDETTRRVSGLEAEGKRMEEHVGNIDRSVTQLTTTISEREKALDRTLNRMDKTLVSLDEKLDRTSGKGRSG